jgi:hypothetical protein
MANSGMSYRTLRDILKVEILSSRGVYSLGKARHLICPICDQFIYGAFDLHEALISKGQVNGHPRQDLINSVYNCVARHNVCPNNLGSHTGGIGGNKIFEKCARNIVKWEGITNVRQWLSFMQTVFPIVAKEALVRFDAIDWIKVCSLP